MVNDSGRVERDGAFDEFAASLFHFNRALRSTAGLWTRLPGRLKRSDVALLRLLHEQGETRPGSIAECLGVGPSVISRRLVDLVEEGLVVRRRDPDDGRAELVALTGAGRERLETLRTAYVAGMRDQFTDWDPEQVRAATELLHEIADHLAPALGREDRG